MEKLYLSSEKSAVAATNGGLCVGFLCAVGCCCESLLGEQWNVVVIVVTDIQHMQTKLSDTKRCKRSISKQCRLRTNRAARTIDDLINGREGALSMTSPMDATEGGRQKIGPLALSMTSAMEAGALSRMPQREGDNK
jgi:hypothetical protein